MAGMATGGSRPCCTLKEGRATTSGGADLACRGAEGACPPAEARAVVVERRVVRKLKASDVIDVLADLFITRGTPGYIRSDNGPEFAAVAVKDWITGVRASTADIEPGSPWENGYEESFNAKLGDELLNTEVFNTLAEVKVLIEQWHRHDNTVRPHSALGDRPLAPQVVPGAVEKACYL